MFKQLSLDLVTFFSSLPAFTAVMQRNVGGENKLFLFPMVASEENSLPLTTYALGEKLPGTKDLNDIAFAVSFWFSIEQYDECCEFTDIIEELIEDSNYFVVSSKIDFNDESKTYSGTININLI